MRSLGGLSVLLAILCCEVASQDHQDSPCPRIYHLEWLNGNVYGAIQIQPRGDIKEVEILVSFNVQTALTEVGTWLLEPVNDSVYAGEPLRYRVRFPALSSVPRLTSLVLNGEELCPAGGEALQDRNSYNITLRHFKVIDGGPRRNILPPTPAPIPATFSRSDQEYDNFFQNYQSRNLGNKDQTVYIGQLQINHFHFNYPHDDQSQRLPHEFFTARPDYTPTQNVQYQYPQSQRPLRPSPFESTGLPPPATNLPKFQGPSLRKYCGVTRNKDAQSLPTSGSYSRGEWPWLVAISKRRRSDTDPNPQFLCVGSLVTERHVITAAHCLRTRSFVTATEDIILKVGAFDLNKQNEVNTQTRGVSVATLHTNFNASTIEYDIAILTMDRPVKFDSFTSPVCLWESDLKSDWVVGTDGIVAGWGESDSVQAGTGTPNFVKIPITCRSSKPIFHRLTSERTLCAGSRDGIGPCVGDSGAGLYVSQNSRWMIRGIVSLSLRPDKHDSGTKCNLQEYIVFTDVAKFMPWIQSILNNSFEDNAGAQRESSDPPSLPVSETPPPDSQNAECGLSPNSGVESLASGDSYKRGDWPWTVAIYHKTPNTFRFSCIGSLVSDRHVITAAHCVQISDKIQIIVTAGSFILADWSDQDFQTRSISSATIHQNYDKKTVSDDIAILTFTTPVRFNDYVRPVCLWCGDTELSNIVGVEGIVTGWGESELGKTPIGPPNYAKMPIVSTETCTRSNPAFNQLTSNTTLCAGARNGVGPCTGDSGGGLFIASKGRWMLRAVVSLALRSNNSCDLNNYVVFTDVAQYLPWIRDVLSRPSPAVVNSTVAQHL